MSTSAAGHAVISEKVEALTIAVNNLTVDVKAYTTATTERIHQIETSNAEMVVKLETVCKDVEKLGGRTDKWWTILNSIGIAIAFVVSFLKGNS